MDNTPDNQRTLLVLSIWAEMTPGKQLAWRGSIRTIDGKRMSFSTLTGLNRLLSELSGWHDSPMDSSEDMRNDLWNER
jgi:environmental stress-induced protein Ves